MNDTVSFFIDGMTCMSCVDRIKTALLKHPGVSRVCVDLTAQSATIQFDSDLVCPENLRSAIEADGYTASESMMEIENNTSGLHDRIFIHRIGPFPYIIGAAAVLGVVGFYLGLLTLTSDWYNAKAQFSEYRWWIIALSSGLGVQAGLFAFMRKRLQNRNIKAAKSGFAASGGMSTASMAACCAHYLVPLLAAVGLPFLSAAAAGISNYQTELFLVGVLSNLFGLGIMLRLMQKNGILKFGYIAIRGDIK